MPPNHYSRLELIGRLHCTPATVHSTDIGLISFYCQTFRFIGMWSFFQQIQQKLLLNNITYPSFKGQMLKEKLTPVLNLLTESCRVHQETRHYLKQQVLHLLFSRMLFSFFFLHFFHMQHVDTPECVSYTVALLTSSYEPFFTNSINTYFLFPLFTFLLNGPN